MLLYLILLKVLNIVLSLLLELLLQALSHLTEDTKSTSLSTFNYDKDQTGLLYDPQMTFNMHVLFEKDNYYNYDLPTEHSSVVESNVCKDTRYKIKTFDY
ncbi:hypothetical protein KM1_297080 [Entamoeba histolytica HM-3:IMSS]|uniref:Uncharacterized protein n=1 Tax=Entamoeba histolytica HM-3:IMSS TaxID=885315 RepID=M7WHW2_ENTHI|nr:hypothetical protein KM1_311810 [Entamoeba histolytica HM-3:IMSS]EMS17410.1 hypothetical protein KM1_297080 [Entamoeba histolytica HM-3:IMSS]